MKIRARFYTFEEWLKKVQELAALKKYIYINVDNMVLELYDNKIDIEIAANDLIQWEKMMEELEQYQNYEDSE